jgi:hypothetical protein
MNPEKTNTFISLAFAIVSVGGLLLLVLYSVQQIYARGLNEFLTSLGFTLGWVFILLLIWVIGSALYHAYLKASGNQSTFPDGERLKDPVEDVLDLDLPYQAAFDLCTLSVSSLTVGQILSSDEKAGIIEGWVSSWWAPTEPWEVQTPNFTMTLQRVQPETTQVSIRFITPKPFVPGDRGHSYIYDLLVFHFHWLSSENEVNVQRVHDFLLENQGRANRPSKDPDTLPDVYFGDEGPG